MVGKRDAHGKIVETQEYDLNNAQISVDSLGQETINKYDVNDRCIETQDAEGSQLKKSITKMSDKELRQHYLDFSPSMLGIVMVVIL